MYISAKGLYNNSMKNIAGRRVIISVIVMLLIFIVGISYLLSYLITKIGSLIVLLLVLWIITKFLAKLLVFPGSYWFWLKMIEANFSSELSEQALNKFRNLIGYLESFVDPEKPHSLHEMKIKLLSKLIETLISNYSLMKSENIIKPSQVHFLNLLNNLKARLKDVIFISSESCMSVWEFIKNPEEAAVTESYEEINDCIKITKEIMDYIKEKTSRSMIRGDYIIGTLSYMRVDLLRRFRCEQFWITGADNAQIDCFWIPGIGNQEKSPVIVFCNPNAAYYEFSYFQTDWIELYSDTGMSLVMWNYRGYGRSKGTPDLKKMKLDGEILIDYLRNQRKCNIIGVHGESLGGSIATHLAKTKKVDFLFADRTFASLSNAARYNFGKLAEVLFKAVGPNDSNSVKDFLDVECFKIVSCDSNDLMINNLASLKSGVALQYFIENNFEDFPFTDTEIEYFCTAIKKIQKTAKFKKDINKEKRKHNKGFLEHSSRTVNLFNYLEDILDNLDAGGQKFLELFENCYGHSLKVWICVLGIWGSTLTVYTNSNLNNSKSAYEKFKSSSDELAVLISEFSLSSHPDIKKVIEDIETLRIFIEKISSWVQNHQPKEEIAGKLLPLTCGHNGSFNSLEKYLYEQYLQLAGFF
jgi:alpha/beta superfamily hydrolase